MDPERELGFATRQIHAGKVKNAAGALCEPIYQTSTFEFDTVEQGGARFAGQESGYIYSRLGNPTVANVEAKLASLEGGDEIVAHETLYGCTFALLNHGMTKFDVKTSLADFSDVENLKRPSPPRRRWSISRLPATPL